MSKLKEKELLEYLEIWKDAFKKALKRCKLISMMKKEIKQTELGRTEQSYQQIKEMIKDHAEQEEIEVRYIEIILDLYDQLEKKKPEVTEEWIQKAIDYIAEYPSYHRLKEKLKEAGVEIKEKK